MRRTAPILVFLLLLELPRLAAAQTAGAAIEGLVINAQNGRAIPRAAVILRNSKNAGAVKSVIADDTGHFLLENLEAGDYRLSAEQQNFFTDSRKRSLHPIIELAAGELRKDVLVRLLPTAVVTGLIVDEHNAPMEHVQIKLLAREYYKGRLTLSLAGLGITDDRGRYRIYDLRPGHYYLLAELDPELRKKGMEVVSGPGVLGVINHAGLQSDSNEPEPQSMVSYAPSFYPATTDYLEATVLDVQSGDELHADFVLTGEPAVSIRGAVVNGLTGERVKNASVNAYWTDVFGANGGSFSGTAGRDGTFEVHGIAPGTYTVRTSFSDETGQYNAQETVEVGPHGAEDVLLAGVPDFDIEGHVVIEGQSVKIPKHVSIDFAPSRIPGAFRVATDGESLDFQARLRPGERYTVNAVGLPGDYYLKDVRTDGQSIERNQLAGSGPHQQLELVLSPLGGHIEGIVQDEKDRPASAYVLLVPDAAHRTYFDLFRKTRAGSDGKFTLRGIPPGTYSLLAIDGVDPDDLINDPDLLKQYEGHAETVIVSEGGHYAPLLHVISAD